MPPIHNTPPTYPEHDKLHAVKHQSQACGEFIDWLESKKGLHLAYYHKHGPQCPGWDEGRQRLNRRSPPPHCEFRENELLSSNHNLKKLLAEFFEIDLNKLEDEKLQLLDEQRKLVGA